MSPTTPWYATPITVGLALFLVYFLNRVVAKAAGVAGLDAATRQRVTRLTTFILAVWFILALVFSLIPASPEAAARPIPISFPLFIGGALLLSLGALTIPAWRRTVDAIPLSTLVGLQFYRTIGLLFVILYSVGTLPGYFALPAGWGDIAVGIAGLLVAYALLRDAPGARGLAIGFNVVGLVDLVMAVGLGTGLLLPLFRPGSAAGPAVAMTVFPLYLIPTFAVPIAVILHLYALREALRQTGRRQMGGRRREERLVQQT